MQSFRLHEDRHLQHQQRQQAAAPICSTGCATAKPDVVCLQELKAADREFPESRDREGRLRRGLARAENLERRRHPRARLPSRSSRATSCPAIPTTTQSRYIEAAVNGVLVASLYAPNGNPQPGPKFAYKLAWMERLVAHAAELYAAGVPVVLAGDYNVVPTDRDIYPTKSYAKNALLQPQPRALFRKIARPGLGRCDPHAASRRADVHVLGLHAEPLAARRRAAPRSSAAEPRAPRSASSAPASIATCAARKARAIMRRPGSCLKDAPKRQNGATQRKQRPTAKPRQSRRASRCQEDRHAGPLLVIDGDSFAHRSYHALPKTILRRGGKPAGAILGFANFLLRLYRAEQPRAVLVAWDTLEVADLSARGIPRLSERPRIRRRAASSSSTSLPEFVAACGFANAKARRLRGRRFPRRRRRGRRTARRHGAGRERRPRHVPARLRARPRSSIPCARARWRASARPKCASATASIRSRCRTSSRCAAIRPTSCPARPASAPAGAATLLRKHGSLEGALKAGRFAAQARRLRLFRSIATMDRKAPLPRLRDQKPTWDKAAALAQEWELNQLAKRLERDGRAEPNGRP